MLGMEKGQQGEEWAGGVWRELERVEGGPKMEPGRSLGELFIKMVWVPAGGAKTRGGKGGNSKALNAGSGPAAVAVVPRLSKVTPNMAWGALKTKAAADQVRPCCLLLAACCLLRPARDLAVCCWLLAESMLSATRRGGRRSKTLVRTHLCR